MLHLGLYVVSAILYKGREKECSAAVSQMLVWVVIMVINGLPTSPIFDTFLVTQIGICCVDLCDLVSANG